MNKKDIPFDIMEAVEPIVKANYDIIGVKDQDNSYYYLYDLDLSSKYYFQVIINPRQLNIDGVASTHVVIQYFPANRNNLNTQTLPIQKTQISTHLNLWVETIKHFNSYISIHDDPFIRKYEDFFLEQFKFIDEDANYAPFDPIQQEAIELFLSKAEVELEALNDEENAEAIQNFLRDSEDVKRGLQTHTKNVVWRRIMNLAAKLYKENRALGKKFLKILTEVGIKELAEKLVKFVSENFHHYI